MILAQVPPTQGITPHTGTGDVVVLRAKRGEQPSGSERLPSGLLWG